MAGSGKTSADSAVALDADGKQLQLDAEKAKYLEAIAKSQQGVADAKAASLKSVLPTVTGAPKGEVTLGDKAGGFGPWRAHKIIDAVAQQIATAVQEKLEELKVPAPRVLVVDDRSLLEGDWTARQARDTLDRLCRRIGALQEQLTTGKQALDRRIRDYTDADAKTGAEGKTRAGTGRAIEREAGAHDGRSGSESLPAPAGTATGAAPAGVPGALGAAVDLLGLIRTDYTLTASTVTPGPAELVTLTSAHLAAQGVAVEADVFSTVRASRSMNKLKTVLGARDDAVQAIFDLAQALAPVEAELAAIAARTGIIEPEWAKAAADAKDSPAALALRQATDVLAQQARGREQAAGPARTLVTYAQQVVADVDAAVTALLQAPEGGQAPLFTAARRERLDKHDDVQDVITHVLYVSLDAVAADTVTRRSILGASGILRFLTATNASWILLDTATGTIAGGSQKSHADIMTFSLETGEAAYSDPAGMPGGTKVIKDPMRMLEVPAKILVVVLAIVLAVLGVLSVVAVIRAVVG
jgi:hypothetical protein